MSTEPPGILYCNCTYAQVIDPAVKAAVLRRLCDSGRSFEAVADLCEMSARKDPALQRLVDNATEGARRGKSLTERMLAFARRQYLQPERVALAELIGGMAEPMERPLGPTSTFGIHTHPQLPPREIGPPPARAASTAAPSRTG